MEFLRSSNAILMFNGERLDFSASSITETVGSLNEDKGLFIFNSVLLWC